MRNRMIMLLLLCVPLLLTACGGGEEETENATQEGADTGTEGEATSENTGNTLDITATNFKFNQEEYTVKAGEPVTVNFSSKEGMHGLGIDQFDVKIQGDGTATFTPSEPGEYQIYCNIPCGAGHADMISTLVVE